MRRRHALVLSLLAALAPAGCSVLAPGDEVCTLAGCRTGLAVELSVRPSAPFRIEATVPGATPAGPAYVYECPDPARCGAVAFFEDFTPARVTIRVTTPAGTVTREFTPTYRTHRPNGEDCPPTCRDATVRVDLPS